MAITRSQLVDPEIPLHYHIASRCVRRSWLCGQDAYSGINYDHRKTWLEERLFQLARCFAVETDALAVMGSHFHLVFYYDPLACLTWSDEEVAWRGVEAFPPMKNGEVSEDLKPIRRDQLLANQHSLKDCRRKPGCPEQVAWEIELRRRGWDAPDFATAAAEARAWVAATTAGQLGDS